MLMGLFVVSIRRARVFMACCWFCLPLLQVIRSFRILSATRIEKEMTNQLVPILALKNKVLHGRLICDAYLHF